MGYVNLSEIAWAVGGGGGKCTVWTENRSGRKSVEMDGGGSVQVRMSLLSF